MSDLATAYDHLARPWTHEHLAEHYRLAQHHGHDEPECEQDHLIRRPVTLLGSAVPACAALSVAIHTIHILPTIADPTLADQVLDSVQTNGGIVLYRCHQALELDSHAHGYDTEEWLPAVYDTAARLLEAVRLEHEPPSLLKHAQDAIRWLSRAIIDVSDNAPDATAGIVDAIGHTLALVVFAEVARR
jgi:hypothetical protein